VIVIGGGNVAYDVARSAVRPHDDSYDVARSALRLSADKEVHVVCLESRAEMPADEIEVIEGSEEGLRLHNSRGPREVLVEDGKVVGLRTVRCTAVFDAQRKFNPQFDEADVEDIPADSVIFAVGQISDLSFLQPGDGVETERGLIKVNRETYQTTAPDVFACGDIAHGARLFIDAIASAQVAARSMHDFLRGTRTDVVVRKQWLPASYTMAERWNVLERENPPSLESDRRAGSLDIVEIDYDEPAARKQAARCLRCNVNTVFETERCVACNGCVDVCPENLIRLVAVKDLIGDFEGEDAGAALIKDETTCIRCAMCASRCPTHAILMREFSFYRECVTVASPNPKVLYQ
jgi:NADPH-dependent glutamate synthase beta subunit-like oxidoreductase